MARDFTQYILFFIEAETSFGIISRIVASDKMFPHESSTPEKLCQYMYHSPKYAHQQLACGEMYRRYLLLAR